MVTGNLLTDIRYGNSEWYSESDWNKNQENNGLVVRDAVLLEPEPTIPDSGGTHQWNTVEGSGTTLADSIGSLDGSISGAIWETGAGAEDTYLSYDGVDDFTSLGSASQSELKHFVTARKGTVFAWINPDDMSGFKVVVGSGASSDDVAWLLRIQDGGDLRFAAFDGDSGTALYDAVATNVLSTGSWTPIAATADAITARVYVGSNMTEEATDTIDAPTTSIDLTHEVRFGARADGTPQHYQGDIDLAWTDDVARSQSDLQHFVSDSEGFYP